MAAQAQLRPPRALVLPDAHRSLAWKARGANFLHHVLIDRAGRGRKVGARPLRGKAHRKQNQNYRPKPSRHRFLPGWRHDSLTANFAQARRTVTQSLALALSIAVEAGVAALFVWRMGWAAPALAALAATLGTLATHGFVWRGVEDGADIIGYWPALALAETAAALAESLFYRLLATPSWRRALALSALANGASSGLGLLLYALDLA